VTYLTSGVCVVWCCVVLCCIVLCCVVLCWLLMFVLCYFLCLCILCCAVLCHSRLNTNTPIPASANSFRIHHCARQCWTRSLYMQAPADPLSVSDRGKNKNAIFSSPNVVNDPVLSAPCTHSCCSRPH